MLASRANGLVGGIGHGTQLTNPTLRKVELRDLDSFRLRPARVLNHFAPVLEGAPTLPPFATHLLKYARLSCAVPFARPAAGLPTSRGGNASAARALHFFATSAVTADALGATAMQTNATRALPIFRLVNTAYLLATSESKDPEALSLAGPAYHAAESPDA